jgi:hypothetical protein
MRLACLLRICATDKAATSPAEFAGNESEHQRRETAVLPKGEGALHQVGTNR